MKTYQEELDRIDRRMLELNDKATYTKGQNQEFYDEIEDELEMLAEERYEVVLKRSKGL